MTLHIYRKFHRLLLTGTTATLLVTALPTSLLLGFSLPATASAEVDLYSLCSKFPMNSRCKGYKVPVSLKQRPGEQGVCVLGSGEDSPSGKCKIVVTDEKMTVYLEQGERLAVLDEQKATQEIDITLSDVVNLAYQEDTKNNTGRRVVNTLIFGVLGALFTKPDKISQLDISFKVEPSQAQESSQLLTVVTGRDFGRSLRAKVEQLTGLKAEAGEQ